MSSLRRADLSFLARLGSPLGSPRTHSPMTPVRVSAADAKRLQRQCGTSPYLQAREIVTKALRPLWGRLDKAHRAKLIALLEVEP